VSEAPSKKQRLEGGHEGGVSEAKIGFFCLGGLAAIQSAPILQAAILGGKLESSRTKKLLRH